MTAEAIKCGCNHMTDFMSFMKTGVTVLEESNYTVFEVITELNVSNLSDNFGFYFAIGFWSSFALFCIFACRVDRSRLRVNFFPKLFMSLMIRKDKGERALQ